MESPDWLHWLSASSLKLEDCVSISLNCQPTIRQEIRETETSLSVEWAITPHCILEGAPNGPDRLYRLRKYFETRPDLLPPVSVPGNAEKRVRLIDFVRFANAQDWSMPPKLMAMLNESSVQANMPPHTAPAAEETPRERRARWLAMFENEEEREKWGALQRVADSEGKDRANMSKAIKKAREERDEQKRAVAWTSQLVQVGKRKP